MTRYTSFQKDGTKIRILKEAESLWKSKGIIALTVEDVMSRAGLTVGGFYGHFRSKEALLSETLKYSLQQASGKLFGNIKSDSNNDWLTKVVKRYLSQVDHRDLSTACPLPLLTPEMARSKAKLKIAFDHEISKILDEVIEHVPGDTPSEKKAKLLAVISCCVGAVAVARALGDSSLAKDMVAEVQTILTQSKSS